MFYYCKYLNGRRYVRAYDDEKHGAPRVVSDQGEKWPGEY